MAEPAQEDRPKAVLVGVQLPGVTDAEHQASLAELGRLVHTMGLAVLATVSQKRAALAIGTVVGEGKLKEIARLTGGTGDVASKVPVRKGRKNAQDQAAAAALAGAEAEAKEAAAAADALAAGDDDAGPTAALPAGKAGKVVFDHELTPNQLRNLETATGAEVLDRTGVIVEIFHRHARTREARMQVEIARLKYLAPRLREARAGADRQGGGIGAKGVGETAHELDRRRIRDRIAELTRELEEMQKGQDERRQRRREQLKVALVGYTNAGKSSLMRALTGSDVLVEDKLFATLDTTIRAMHPETAPRILVSDTVGFIKKLPHDLVASFRSTLDEAADASLLLFLVDAADPTFRSQLAVTRGVLAEIGADTAPSLLILNKCDCLDGPTRTALASEFPGSIQLSTRDADDVARLRGLVISFFERSMAEAEFYVPYGRGDLLSDVHRTMRIISETHTDTGTKLTVRAFPDAIARLTKLLGPP